MRRVSAICPFSRLLIVTGEPSCTARLLYSFHSCADCCVCFIHVVSSRIFETDKNTPLFPFKFWFSVQPLEGFSDFFFFFPLGGMYNCNLLRCITCGAFDKTMNTNPSVKGNLNG